MHVHNDPLSTQCKILLSEQFVDIGENHFPKHADTVIIISSYTCCKHQSKYYLRVLLYCIGFRTKFLLFRQPGQKVRSGGKSQRILDIFGFGF